MMEELDKQVYDSRIILYKSVRLVVFIVAIALLVKVCLFDSIAIRGNQMAPTIVKGDQTLIFKLPYLSFFSSKFKPSLAKPVIFQGPFGKKKLDCFRIAGVWGDTVAIDSGKISNSRKGELAFSGRGKNRVVVPASFSPRDYFTDYRVPCKGDHFILDSLPLRDLFFALSVIRQENKKSIVTVKADLYIDDTLSNDYFIKEFSLYKGTVDTIPVKYQDDWFFWDRLDQYLSVTAEEYSAEIRFKISIDSVPVSDYTVKNNYVFMLADNWSDGLDSRYIGPIQASCLVGRVFFVLWSANKKSEGGINFKRIGRIIR